jgi:protein-L-isoaspartate(D-aspartate) O-methyltransferase
MVESQLIKRGINDPRVLEVMSTVPRENYVPEDVRRHAYEDRALPIPGGQSISQPYMVGIMLQALKLDGHEHVLEIGTGSAYQTVLLALLARKVDTIEIVPELAESARQRLNCLGLKNATVYERDGSGGLPGKEPFDDITVTAAAPDIPAPYLDQLSPDGKLLLPIGSRDHQELVLIEKREKGLMRSVICRCQFVPLLGEYGFGKE